MLFQAGFVSIGEEYGVLLVGFADREFNTVQYLLLQRGTNPELDEGVHLELMNQARSGYGGIISCRLSRESIELMLDDRTARNLETANTLTIGFSCDDATYRRLIIGLERLLLGTSCELRAHAH